ncbi:hypothetical protein LZ30DRAFT_304448 [Colletotrichum cereale]|nr:hypothetical protein LZ30DRAFT_304448 [Colletotrichum cereale]
MRWRVLALLSGGTGFVGDSRRERATWDVELFCCCGPGRHRERERGVCVCVWRGGGPHSKRGQIGRAVQLSHRLVSLQVPSRWTGLEWFRLASGVGDGNRGRIRPLVVFVAKKDVDTTAQSTVDSQQSTSHGPKSRRGGGGGGGGGRGMGWMSRKLGARR